MNRNIQVFKPLIRPEAIRAVTEVLQSGWIGNGPRVKQFEQDFQAYLGTTNGCVAVMSATDGLDMAVQLLDLGPGDEVITTPITFISTNHVILYAGATPVFADVDINNGCISPESIKAKITPKTKAIMLVHLAGASADMGSIEKIAQDNNLKIIEDCAHACGGLYKNGANKGKKIGNSQNISVFSFQAVKTLPMGDGGMLVLPTDELKQKSLKLRWLGIDKDTYSRTAKTGEYIWKYDVPHIGIKSNVNDILGAIGVEQLKYLDNDNIRRREIAKFYKDQLGRSPYVRVPDIDIDQSSCHFYPVFVAQRDNLMNYLRSQGISCGMHYISNARYDTYKSYNSVLPNAEHWSEFEITLPIHLLLTDEELRYIVDKIEEFYK